MSTHARDRRESERHRCSRSIWWRRRTDDLLQQGWLVDESDRGLAFITRTETPLRPGEHIQTLAEPEPSPARAEPRPRGVVRRVQPIQSGVTLVAVELFTSSASVVTRAVRAQRRAAA